MSGNWLQSWLEGLSLAEYRDTLHGHGYTTPEGLAAIQDRDQLKALGVTKVGHLTRLFRAIQKLQEDAPPPTISSIAVESNSSNGPSGNKDPPPVPKRKSVRRTTSSPISPAPTPAPTPAPPSSPLANNVPARSTHHGPPPPVQPRDQSLKRMGRPIAASRGTKSASSLLSPVLQSPAPTLPIPIENSSPNGHTYPSSENLATSPTKNPTQSSPTPKPRSKHPPRPAPRKQRAGTVKPIPSSHPDNDNLEKGERREQVVASTLPVGSHLDATNGTTPPSSISPSPEMLTSTELSGRTDGPPEPMDRHHTPVSDGLESRSLPPADVQQPPLPPKERGPPPFAPPPLPPDRKHFSDTTPKDKSDNAPVPPVPYQRKMSPEKRATMADSRSRSGSPSKPLPYSSTLPANRAQNRASESPPRLPRQTKLSSPPLPDLPPLPPKDPRFSSPPPSTAPPRSPVSSRKGQMPAPTINTTIDSIPPEEDPPDPPRADSDSETDEDEGEGSRMVIRSLQQHRKSDAMFIAPQLHGGGGLEETSDLSGASAEASPAHTSGTIRQQSTGSRQRDHDDDIIPLGATLDNENPDYMNQDAIETSPTPNSGTIHQRSTQRDHEDDIIPLGGTEEVMDPDYMNQDAIETSPIHTGGTIRQWSTQRDHEDDIIPLGGAQEVEDPDYMNQDAIDEEDMDDLNSEIDSEDERNCHAGGTRKIIMSQKSDRKGSIDIILGLPLMGAGQEDDASDYMNQDAIDDMEEEKELNDAPGSDYLNQAAIDSAAADIENEATSEDDANTWSAIEYMNQSIIDQVHEEIQKQEAEGLDYINQDVIDSTFNVGEPVYDTEDDLTEDELDGEDGDSIRIHSYREPLQIRGTFPAKSRTIKPENDDLDYMNQDVVEEVLEGDIIPMVVAGGTTDLSLDMTQSSWVKNADEAKAPSGGLKTKAEASDEGGEVSVSHDQINDSAPDQARASFCSADSEASSLDYTCRRQTVGDGLAVGRKRVESKLKDAQEIAQSLDVQATTKPRSHTDAHPLADGRPPPLSLNPYRSSSQETPDGSDIRNQFNRDYIPPVLPKSAGTFAGGDYRKPDFRKFKSTDDNNSRNSVLRDSLSESTILPGFSRLSTSSAVDVPKTKEGFLHKKGGRKNNRPWQKRWVVFNGSELKYFQNKQDKDYSCLNTVELEKMIDVKRVPDEVEKQYRFDLVVINRVFQFYSESMEDRQAWVDVLHVAISKFKPQEHEHKEGGTMHDPDKQGYLHKQGHGFVAAKSFRERYVALKGSKFAYYENQEEFKLGRPINTLEMSLASVRPDMASKLPRFLITMNNQKQYLFQCSTDLDRNQWVEALTMAIMTGLDIRPQTLPRGKTSRVNKSKEILARLQENPSNKRCADCAAVDPVWCVINRGIMVCIRCSGPHRSFGTHLSKVRSIELDEEIWTNEEQINLMLKIGNANSNMFWEKHMQSPRLEADVEDVIREGFLHAKYVTRTWIPRGNVEDKDVLGMRLCENVATDDLMKTIELLAQGANPCHLLADVEDSEKNTPLAIARSTNQTLQAKLLELNGASVCRKEDRQSFSMVSKKGHLYKTGTERTGWKRRYCTLDQFRGFEYYKTETDSELQGYIRIEEMFSVSKTEEETSKDSKYRHCFEVNTRGRGYLFCADSAEEMEEWINAFKRIINSDTADNLGYDKVGYLKKKDQTGWKKRWFTLKGKSLACYKKEREELDEIDLRKVVELKGPDSSGTPEQQCLIQILTDDKTYHLKADTLAEAESWMSALRHTQVSGIPLGEQQLTSNSIPIVIHKCLQFIESIGLEWEGLYRISGEKAKIRKLILAFNQDARGVVIDPDKYTVHDVTGTLKQFLQSLPDPVLTRALYKDFISTIQSEHEAQMYQIQTLLDRLPQVNRETLKRIIGHLRRVVDNESKNKMGLSNISSLFGPTLMTVNDGPSTFANTQFECTCIHTMIKYYKWLFQVAEDENRKDEAIQEAVEKIKELEAMQKKRAELKSQKQSTISSSTDFLTTIYIGNKLGDTYNTRITGVTTVQNVVEQVVTQKDLAPDTYALYLVLGDSESHRVLCFSERLLAVICSAGTEHYLCLQRNTMWETLHPHFGRLLSGEAIQLHVREKKKWKKHPCCLRDNHFIQFKDNKCHNEAYKIGINEFDIFLGSKLDVKNPAPTRHSFWIKAMKGEEQCRYLCADNQDDMLNLIATVVKAKFPSCLQTPVLPFNSPPPSSPSSFPQSPDELSLGRPYTTSPPLSRT